MLAIILFPLLFLAGCGQGLPKFNIERDNYSTGGNITFSWDKEGKIVCFGGENEVIQYYDKDITKGFLKGGNRVGIKIIPSQNIEDLGSLTFKIDKDEISGQNVVTKVSDSVSFFQIFPLVERAGQKIEINIEYKDKKDKIIVKIHEKSILMAGDEQK